MAPPRFLANSRCAQDVAGQLSGVWVAYAIACAFAPAVRPSGGAVGAICFIVLVLVVQRYVASGYVTTTLGKLGWHYEGSALGASVRGRLVVVTGASSGIGFWTAAELARLGAKVVVTARTAARAEATRAQVAAAAGVDDTAIVAALPLELGDRASIRAFASELGAVADRVNGGAVDIVVHNAGAAGHPGGRRVTADGVELMLACNYLGPFLLTELLAPRLKRSSSGRVVFLGSKATMFVKSLQHGTELLHRDYTQGRDLSGMAEILAVYGVSKWGVAALARDVSKRHGIEACTVHPGVASSDFLRSIPIADFFLGKRSYVSLLLQKTVYEGAIAVLHCILARSIVPGAYYRDSAEASHVLDAVARPENDAVVLGWAKKTLSGEREIALGSS